MVSKGEQTEKKIIDAAHQVFTEKGYHGARMQEIADTAEINKGLLHYYFKTKDALFERIFGIAFDRMFSKMLQVINSDRPLAEKLDEFIDNYISVLAMNSFLPAFVISELNRNPDRFLKKIFSKSGKPDLKPFFAQVERDIAAGKIRDIDPKHLVVSIMAMAVFPFVARPMMQAILNMPNAEYKNFLKNRKEEIMKMVNAYLAP